LQENEGIIIPGFIFGYHLADETIETLLKKNTLLAFQIGKIDGPIIHIHTVGKPTAVNGKGKKICRENLLIDNQRSVVAISGQQTWAVSTQNRQKVFDIVLIFSLW
jgi:hypothetical protein